MSQCGSTYNCLCRSVPEMHSHVAGKLSSQQTNNLSQMMVFRLIDENRLVPDSLKAGIFCTSINCVSKTCDNLFPVSI